MYSLFVSSGHGRRLSGNLLSGVSLFIAIALGLVKSSSADEIQFQPAQLLSIAPGTQAIPCVSDWNGDGLKDLLVGYLSAGKIALYINTGTDTNPVFSTYANLNGGPSNIIFTSSGCGAPAPFVCDYNNDGKRDLLVGQGANGYVYYNLLAGHLINGITKRVASGVPSAGVTTCWTNVCGDTQQFFRLQIAQ